MKPALITCVQPSVLPGRGTEAGSATATAARDSRQAAATTTNTAERTRREAPSLDEQILCRRMLTGDSMATPFASAFPWPIIGREDLTRERHRAAEGMPPWEFSLLQLHITG